MFPRNKKSKSPNQNQKIISEELREEGRAPLSEIAKQVKNIELITKRKMEEQMVGAYKSRFRGHGMQFSDFRVYQFGDDIRHIDWRTSARSQQTYIKIFEEERELNVIFLIDASASTGFGSQTFNKRETLSLAIAALAFTAIANNDRVGLILFSDQIERYVPAKKGKKHILRLIDEILTFKPKSKGTDLNVALNFLNNVVKTASILFIASDFLTKIEKTKLKRIVSKHDVIAIHVQDPRDSEFPKIGLVQLEDPETGETIILDTNAAAFQKALQTNGKKEIEKVLEEFKRSSISAIPISTAKNPIPNIFQFFLARKRGKR